MGWLLHLIQDWKTWEKTFAKAWKEDFPSAKRCASHQIRSRGRFRTKMRLHSQIVQFSMHHTVTHIQAGIWPLLWPFTFLQIVSSNFSFSNHRKFLFRRVSYFTKIITVDAFYTFFGKKAPTVVKLPKNWSIWRVFKNLKHAFKKCYQTGQK